MRSFTSAVVLMMAIAVAGCKSSSKRPPIEKHSPLADSADQIMFGAKFNMTDNGVARALLMGDTAFFFDANTRVELENVHTTFFTTAGVKSGILTAKHGTYRTQNGLMTARGNVVVISDNGSQLRSPELNYDQAHNQIFTDSSFVQVDSIGRSLTGVGFRSDPDLKNVHILKVISGTGGTVIIPNQ